MVDSDRGDCRRALRAVLRDAADHIAAHCGEDAETPCLPGDATEPVAGWILYLIAPLVLMTGLLIYFVRSIKNGNGSRQFLAVSLLVSVGGVDTTDAERDCFRNMRGGIDSVYVVGASTERSNGN